MNSAAHTTNPNVAPLTNETIVTKQGAEWHPTRNEDGTWIILNADFGTVVLSRDATASALTLANAGYQVG